MSASQAGSLPGLLREFGPRPLRLLVPVALSLAGAVCECLCALLLVPAVEGSIRLDFALPAQSPVLRTLLGYFPALARLPGKSQFLLLLAAIAAMALLKTALVHGAAVYFNKLVQDLTGNARRALYGAVLGAGKAFFDLAHSARVQNVMVAQVNVVAANAILFHDSATHLFMLAAYATAMAWISIPLTLILACVLPVLHLAGARLASRIKNASLANGEAQGRMSERVAETCRNISLVQAEDAQALEAERFAKTVERANELQAQVDIRASLTPKLQESIFILMMVALLLGLASAARPERTDLVPSLFVFVYLARRASISAMAVLRLKTVSAIAAGAAADVAAMLYSARSQKSEDGTLEFQGLKSGLEARGLTLVYPNGFCALDDVSFELPKGETLALVGPSGAGKSSLVHLLLRFYAPSKGAFLSDATDIRRFTARSLAAKFAFIPQSPQLLDDTLQANLVYPSTGPADPATLREALRKAALAGFVDALPGGLEARIGEGGVRLSGGERQRLALARAMLKDADILVLDEATSALDSATENRVRTSIAAATAGRTAIVIAHRLSTIQHADRVLVLDGGRVVQRGTFDSLKAADGLFRRMLERQEFA